MKKKRMLGILRKVVMPESVLCIGDEAFGRCVSQESVVVPPSVEEMGRNPYVGLDSKVIDNRVALACDGV